MSEVESADTVELARASWVLELKYAQGALKITGDQKESLDTARDIWDQLWRHPKWKGVALRHIDYMNRAANDMMNKPPSINGSIKDRLDPNLWESHIPIECKGKEEQFFTDRLNTLRDFINALSVNPPAQLGKSPSGC